MYTALTWAVFILILGVMILVHEFGHFIAARLVGIKVEEFSIGMGPELWSKVKNKVKYTVRAFPIGGFVKMFGEEDMDIDAKGSFGSRTVWQRLFVVSAGVIMNFILVIVIAYIIGAIMGFRYVFPLIGDRGVLIGDELEKPVVANIAENSPAEIEGLKLNEIVLYVDGNDFSTISEFQQYVKDNAGDTLVLTLGETFSKKTREVSLVPRVDPPEGEGALGIQLASIGIVEYPGLMKIGSGLFYSIDLMAYNVVVLGDLVGQSFREKAITPISDSVAGPIGLFYILRGAVEYGAVVGILFITAIIGISLVLVNLLPIPALDGSYIIFLLIEGISGKRIPGSVLKRITQVGMILLIGLIVAIAVNDLFRFTPIKDGLCSAFRVFCN